MEYLVKKKRNPQNRDELKFYCTPHYNKTRVTTTDIAKELSKMSTLTPYDIKPVIDGTFTSIAEHCSKGEIVNIDGIGTFRLAFKSDGHDKVAEVTGRDIHSVHIHFRGSGKFKAIVDSEPAFIAYDPAHTERGSDTSGGTGGSSSDPVPSVPDEDEQIDF